MTNMKQIAARAGVSLGTVSHALNDSAKVREPLRKMSPRPTAILACNDMIALGALMAIRDEHLRCPEDISLIGFDGLDLTEMTTPQLSSVSQSSYQMGAAACSTGARSSLEQFWSRSSNHSQDRIESQRIGRATSKGVDASEKRCKKG